MDRPDEHKTLSKAVESADDLVCALRTLIESNQSKPLYKAYWQMSHGLYQTLKQELRYYETTHP